MATIDTTLPVRLRTRSGTTAAQNVRAAGSIPAILFGHGVESTSLEIDAKAFDALLHAGGRHAMLTIAIEGGDTDTVMVRDVQRDPVSRRVLHADLQRVSKTETITSTLPIVAVGEAHGVKIDGGVLDVVLHEISVSGPATAMPEHIDVDVTAMTLHRKLTAGEIALPQGLKLASAADAIVLNLEPSRVAEQVSADEAVATEQIAAAEAEVAAAVPAPEAKEGEDPDDVETPAQPKAEA